MIRLKFRERLTDEPNTFIARVDGSLVVLTASFRMTDVRAPAPLVLPCWYMLRSRIAPNDFDRPIFPMRRMSAECLTVLGVPFGPGHREDVWLLDVVEIVANDWQRRAAAEVTS